MVDRYDTQNPGPESEAWLAQTPKISDALKKSMIVSVITWSNREIAGVICDRDQTGLLLDVRESGSDGYAFLPWSSIERVNIREVAQRKVKHLPS
jgi:DNA-binding helix-hairpin-helix protein with protein kinase domain